MNIKRVLPALALIFAVNIMIITLAQDAAAASFRKGSSGETVTQIQKKLKNWGYYNGVIDGVYGSKTEEAVKAFQAKNGLTADGVAGAKTLAALGISASSGASSQSNDLNLLAKVISAEARGEPYKGQVAVGAVILNRVKHPSFPNTLSGVVYQPWAFTCMHDGQINEKVTDSAYKAARDAMNGYDPSGGAIYYFNPATATSSWIWSRQTIVVIGKHRFCL